MILAKSFDLYEPKIPQLNWARIGREAYEVNTCERVMKVQANLGDIAVLVPDHCNKVIITIYQVIILFLEKVLAFNL